MNNTITNFFHILRRRLSEEEILKIAEVRKDIFEDKAKIMNISQDQMALSIYYKMYSEISNDELILLHSFEKETFH